MRSNSIPCGRSFVEQMKINTNKYGNIEKRCEVASTCLLYVLLLIYNQIYRK